MVSELYCHYFVGRAGGRGVKGCANRSYFVQALHRFLVIEGLFEEPNTVLLARAVPDEEQSKITTKLDTLRCKSAGKRRTLVSQPGPKAPGKITPNFGETHAAVPCA